METCDNEGAAHPSADASQPPFDLGASLAPVFQFMTGGFARVRLDGCLIDHLSAGVLELLGYAPSDAPLLEGGRAIDLVVDYDRERVSHSIRSKLAMHSQDALCLSLTCSLLAHDGTPKGVYLQIICNTETDGTSWANIVISEMNTQPQEEFGRRKGQTQLLPSMVGITCYRYDFATDTITFSLTDAQGGMKNVTVEHYVKNLDNDAFLTPDSIKTVRKAFDCALHGTAYQPLELQSCIEGGGYKWYRSFFTTFFDKDGSPRQVVGMSQNDENVHEQIAHWQMRAELDGLTGLLNHTAMRDRVDTLLAKNGAGTMLLLDIDNFKSINDRYGHTVGDEVLLKVAEALRATFRSNDVIGRTGGDEFEVFVTDKISHETATSMARRLLQRLHDIPLAQGTHLSCSVGISSMRDGGASSGANDLASLADRAMYRVKFHGKDGYAFYDPAIDAPTRTTATAHISKDAPIEENLVISEPDAASFAGNTEDQDTVGISRNGLVLGSNAADRLTSVGLEGLVNESSPLIRLFEGGIGGISIIEYLGGSIAPVVSNDRFFQLMGVEPPCAGERHNISIDDMPGPREFYADAVLAAIRYGDYACNLLLPTGHEVDISFHYIAPTKLGEAVLVLLQDLGRVSADPHFMLIPNVSSEELVP